MKEIAKIDYRECHVLPFSKLEVQDGEEDSQNEVDNAHNDVYYSQSWIFST